MKNMFFSVVIPVYNSSSYIAETLNSVRIAFQNKNYEIIIIDDCSSDIESLKSILYKFPKSILIEKNNKSNAADSRNIGLIKSKGDYVFFLDSDDHFINDAIDRRIELHKSKNAGMIFGEFLINCGNEDKPSNLPYYETEDMRNYLFTKNGDCRSSSISICKKNYSNTLFDPLSNKHQDWIYAIRCFDNNENIYFDNRPTVVINIDREGRMSASMNIDASRYIYTHYINEKNHINSFSRKHWLSMICGKDEKACDFFFSIFKPISLSDYCVLMSYKFSAKKPFLYISSYFIYLVRKMK